MKTKLEVLTPHRQLSCPFSTAECIPLFADQMLEPFLTSLIDSELSDAFYVWLGNGP